VFLARRPAIVAGTFFNLVKLVSMPGRTNTYETDGY